VTISGFYYSKARVYLELPSANIIALNAATTDKLLFITIHYQRYTDLFSSFMIRIDSVANVNSIQYHHIFLADSGLTLEKLFVTYHLDSLDFAFY
jgi:hypothetical protein